MKFDWASRKNLIFIAQILLAIFLPILGYFGLTGADITTWAIFFSTIVSAIKNPYVIFLIICSVWQTINNPTTNTLGD